jgi:1-acyl-sn-glycerol-3-phosphate acyltransferase
MTRFPELMIQRAMRVIARALAARRLQTSVRGLEHVPLAGPALIVARHYHHLFDGVALFAALPRPFHIVVTLDWVTTRASKIFFQTLTTWAGWPLVLRREAVLRNCSISGRPLFAPEDIVHYQRRALRRAVDLLLRGRIVVVFPEGYPNIDPSYTPKHGPDEFLPFKPGFVAMAAAAESRLGASVPIIPLGIRYQAGKPWVATLSFGPIIYRARFAQRATLVTYAEDEVKRLSRFTASSSVEFRR